MTLAIYTTKANAAYTTPVGGHPYLTESDPVYLTENSAATYVTLSATPYLLEDSTLITFTPSPPFVQAGNAITAKGPIAAGVTVGQFVVTPTNWVGLFVLSGQSTAFFKLVGNSLVTVAQLTSGQYNLTITVTE